MDSRDGTVEQILILTLCMQANVPILVWGKPGEGKSRIAEAIFKELDWPFYICNGANMDPTDVGGWPVDAGEDGIVRRAPQWAIDLSERKIGEKRGGIFFEELNLSPKANQAAFMRIAHDAVVGDEKLGPGVCRIAAANPLEYSAGGWNLDPPFANRFYHLNWQLSTAYWCEAMVNGFKPPQFPLLPETWMQYLPLTRAEIQAYIRHQPTALSEIPKDESKASGAFPTPRSWTMAASLLAAARALGLSDGIKLRLVEGSVGGPAAGTYMHYRASLDLPDPEDTLKAPEKFVVKMRGDKMYALLSAVTAVVLARNTAPRWEQAWDVLARAGEVGGKDVTIACAGTLANNKPAGVNPAKWGPKMLTLWDTMVMAGLVNDRMGSGVRHPNQKRTREKADV